MSVSGWGDWTILDAAGWLLVMVSVHARNHSCMGALSSSPIHLVLGRILIQLLGTRSCVFSAADEWSQKGAEFSSLPLSRSHHLEQASI